MDLRKIIDSYCSSLKNLAYHQEPDFNSWSHCMASHIVPGLLVWSWILLSSHNMVDVIALQKNEDGCWSSNTCSWASNNVFCILCKWCILCSCLYETICAALSFTTLSLNVLVIHWWFLHISNNIYFLWNILSCNHRLVIWVVSALISKRGKTNRGLWIAWQRMAVQVMGTTLLQYTIICVPFRDLQFSKEKKLWLSVASHDRFRTRLQALDVP